MLTRQDMLHFIGQNPGTTNKDVAAAFGIKTSEAATRTKQLVNGGFVTRKVIGRTPTKAEIYGYWVNNAVTPAMSKKERVGTTVEQRLDNDKTIAQGGDITALISNLSQALAKQIAAQVVVDLQSQLQRELAAIIPPNVTVPKLALDALLPAPVVEVQPKVRLPRIGILGMAPPKRKPIDDEFGSIFDIVYWWSEDNDSKLKSMSTQCEVIYVMDYVSHKHTQMMQARGANLRRVHGDITALTNLLTEKYLEGVK